MLAIVDVVSHAVLRALGAEIRQLATAAGAVNGYELRGRGQGTVVLLHGMGTAATSYLPAVRALLPDVGRLVLIDLPGHGRSSAPTGGLDAASLALGVKAALDQLLAGRERAVLVGTSLGGAAALGYALERPEHLCALVLVSPGGAPLSEQDASSGESVGEPRGLG